MKLFADRIVFAGEGNELAQLGFELAVLFAQGDDLPLGDRYGVPAMRMRHIDLGE